MAISDVSGSSSKPPVASTKASTSTKQKSEPSKPSKPEAKAPADSAKIEKSESKATPGAGDLISNLGSFRGNSEAREIDKIVQQDRQRDMKQMNDLVGDMLFPKK